MSDKGWPVSEIQRLREELEMQARFYAVEQEAEERRVLGDDVYEFMRGRSKA